jgi:hypothetical protein
MACTWRWKYRRCSQGASQAPPATETSSHWPRSEAGATARPSSDCSARSAGSARDGLISVP